MHGLEAVDFRFCLAPKIMFTQFQPIAKNFCPCLRKRDILYFTLSLVNVTTVNTTSILDQQLKRGPSRILADYLRVLNDYLFGHSKTILFPWLISCVSTFLITRSLTVAWVEVHIRTAGRLVSLTGGWASRTKAAFKCFKSKTCRQGS